MEPTRYKRAIALLRAVAFALSSLLSLVPMLEKLLLNWPSGSNPSDIQEGREGTTQVNPGKETTDE